MKKLIADLDAYAFRKGWPKYCVILVPIFYTTSWPIIEYRFNNWVHFKVKIPVIRQVLKMIGFVLHRIISSLFSVEISERAIIGKGIFIAHFGDIVIGHSSVIGENVSIHQGVTLGGSGYDESRGFPVLGDNVYLSAGAKIVGKVKIGSNVIVGANAVVVKDVPDNVSVGGVPAKIIKDEGSQHYIQYRNKIV